MRRLSTLFFTLSAAVVLLVTAAANTQDQGTTREFTVVGDHYNFGPQTIEVNRNDLVKVTFTAHDMAHSFTVDDYRISKRASAGQTVTFEFRADRPGTFTYYCSLAQDDACKNMKGKLVVK